MPDTTPMPNETAKMRVQKIDSRRYSVSRFVTCRPSSSTMNDARPTVNAGSRMWNAMTKANCRRDRKTGSRSMGTLFQSDQRRCARLAAGDAFYPASGLTYNGIDRTAIARSQHEHGFGTCTDTIE